MDFANLLQPGLKAEISDTVTEKNTASAWGSGDLDVFATPAMIAIMEKAALTVAASRLPHGWSTVGTEVNVTHISATPRTMKVTAKAELLSIDGRALSFKVEAFDESGKIGEGVHNRFIIEKEKFMSKTEAKNSQT